MLGTSTDHRGCGEAVLEDIVVGDQTNQFGGVGLSIGVDGMHFNDECGG